MRSIFIFHDTEAGPDGQPQRHDISEERDMTFVFPVGQVVRYKLGLYRLNELTYTFDKDVTVYDLYPYGPEA
jgi:hypothetical protein